MKRKNNSNYRTYTLLSAIIIIAAAALFFTLRKEESIPVSVTDGNVYVHYIDVGQGDCEMITLPTGEVILIDCGPMSSSRSLVKYLRDQGVSKIDYMILTHPHEDHIGSAKAIYKNFPVYNTVLSSATSDTTLYSNLLKTIDEYSKCSMIRAEPSKTISVGSSVVELLGPISDDAPELNNTSVVLRFVYSNTSFIFMGDAEEDEENAILTSLSEKDITSDVIKIGHHGSSSSTTDALLDRVNPVCAVISCGRLNDYGHPHKALLERLSNRNIDIHRTDTEGSIVFATNGDTVSLITKN